MIEVVEAVESVVLMDGDGQFSSQNQERGETKSGQNHKWETRHECRPPACTALILGPYDRGVPQSLKVTSGWTCRVSGPANFDDFERFSDMVVEKMTLPFVQRQLGTARTAIERAIKAGESDMQVAFRQSCLSESLSQASLEAVLRQSLEGVASAELNLTRPTVLRKGLSTSDHKALVFETVRTCVK